MFSVNELIEIINVLSKDATFENICDLLGKKRNRVIYSNDKAFIRLVLENDKSIIYDNTNNVWFVRKTTIENQTAKASEGKYVLAKGNVIREIGNWKIFLKSWASNDYHTVIRNRNASIDITMQKDGFCKIWSAKPIKKLVLNNKSKNKIEPRPYFYIVNKSELHEIFNDMDTSIIELLDNKSHNKPQ